MGFNTPLAIIQSVYSQLRPTTLATELESLPIFKAIDYCAIHQVECTFEVVTNHHALTSLLTSTKLNLKLVRWALALQLTTSTSSTAPVAVTRMQMAFPARSSQATPHRPSLWQKMGSCWGQPLHCSVGSSFQSSSSRREVVCLLENWN